MDKKSSSAKTADNKPVKTLNFHGVQCSIFANEAKRDEGTVTYYKVSLVRVYKDGDEFKRTPSLGRDDLPAASFLLEKAYDYIADAEQSSRDSDDE